METNKLLALAQHLDIPYIEDDNETLYFGATQADYDVYVDLNEDVTPLDVSEWIVEQDGYIDFENEVEVTDDLYTYGNERYLILDESEAENAWEESIDSFIDACILSGIPDQYHNYFDREAFAKDCSYDGRGSQLATYDGIEIEQTVNACDYYLYRTN